MKKLTSKREIQGALLQAYKELTEVWDRHGYRYYLTGGSTLGAIRHKGFIPWDDDLDVGLSREDYEDFIQRTFKELPEYLKLVWRSRGQQHAVMDLRYGVDLNEEMQEALFEDLSQTAHPYVDLQVFDGLPSNRIRRFLFCCHVFFLRVCIKLGDPDRIYTGKWRPAWENCMICVVKKLSVFFPSSEKATVKYLKLIKKHSFDDSLYIADFVGKYHFKDTYPKAWWEPAKMVQFEDIMAPVPGNYDAYLKQIYGDYMTIPKQEDRLQHVRDNAGDD